MTNNDNSMKEPIGDALRSAKALVLTHARPLLATQLVKSLVEDEGFDPSDVVLVINGDGGLSDSALQEKVHTIVLPENLGAAGGMRAGLIYIRDHSKCDWIYVCEDDVPLAHLRIPRVAELIRAVEDQETHPHSAPIGAVSGWGLHLDILTGSSRVHELQGDRRFQAVDVSGWGATLLSRRVLDADVLPDARLFFGYEDWDFWLRMRRKGFELVIDTQALDPAIYGARRGFVRAEPLHAIPWRGYYQARNFFELRRRYGCRAWTARHFVRSFRRIKKARSWSRRAAILLGLAHGLSGRLGRSSRYSGPPPTPVRGGGNLTSPPILVGDGSDASRKRDERLNRRYSRRNSSAPQGAPRTTVRAEPRAANGGQDMVGASEPPLLSAVVISKDDERRIEATVRSVLSQRCDDPFEVIVVTSGTDRTADIVREKFPNVHMIELSEPALPGKARNVGLDAARGDIVSFPGSHVELPHGSLAARMRAHRRGFEMVTGSALNGTKTASGWAAYFLDHSTALPGRPSGELDQPPVHCSYLARPLREVGGFPEQLRAGEDTIVNHVLMRLGYRAYRSQTLAFVHRNPCGNPMALVRHRALRGRALGRILIDKEPADVPPAEQTTHHEGCPLCASTSHPQDQGGHVVGRRLSVHLLAGLSFCRNWNSGGMDRAL